MQFAAKAGTNYDGLNIPTLPPGIYKNCKLIDMKKDVTTPSGGGEGTKILSWTAEAPEGLHQHTEYDIKADDPKAQSKSDSMTKRIGHLLRQFNIPQATIDAMPVQPDFESYCNWVMATLGQSYVGVTFELKVVGNVYNGKATSDIPGYIPYMASGNAGTKSLSFSASEVRQNQDYNTFQSSANKPDVETTGAVPATRDTDF